MIIRCPHCGGDIRIKHIKREKPTKYQNLTAYSKKRLRERSAKSEQLLQDRTRGLALNHGRLWTSAEFEYLKEHYLTETLGDIAIVLGRTHQSVAKKAHLLGLNTKHVVVGRENPIFLPLKPITVELPEKQKRGETLRTLVNKLQVER